VRVNRLNRITIKALAKLGDQHSSETKCTPPLFHWEANKQNCHLSQAPQGWRRLKQRQMPEAQGAATGKRKSLRHASGRWSDNFLCSARQMFLFRFYFLCFLLRSGRLLVSYFSAYFITFCCQFFSSFIFSLCFFID